MPTQPPLRRRLFAELLGSAFLAALVIGSGIAAQTLSPNNVGSANVSSNSTVTAPPAGHWVSISNTLTGSRFHPSVVASAEKRNRVTELIGPVGPCSPGMNLG